MSEEELGQIVDRAMERLAELDIQYTFDKIASKNWLHWHRAFHGLCMYWVTQPYSPFMTQIETQ